MKVLHIEGTASEEFELPAKVIEKIEADSIALCTTIQFTKSLPRIAKQLEDSGKKIILIQGNHSAIKGQILGCDVPKLNESVDSILFIGDGEFHPKALFLKNNLPVFAYNPYNKQIEQIDDKSVEVFAKHRKIALVKFHSSEIIGIIVSTKQGQRASEDKLEKLESKYPEKKFYKFIADTIDFSQLENFPFIESWINTACPRIAYDDSSRTNKAILNIDDLEV